MVRITTFDSLAGRTSHGLQSRLRPPALASPHGKTTPAAANGTTATPPEGGDGGGGPRQHTEPVGQTPVGAAADGTERVDGRRAVQHDKGDDQDSEGRHRAPCPP